MLSTSYYPWDLQTHNVHSIIWGKCCTRGRDTIEQDVGLVGMEQDLESVVSDMLQWSGRTYLHYWYLDTMLPRWLSNDDVQGKHWHWHLHRPQRPLHPHLTTAWYTAPAGGRSMHFISYWAQSFCLIQPNKVGLGSLKRAWPLAWPGWYPALRMCWVGQPV